jgi:outer membrane protein TolC
MVEDLTVEGSLRRKTPYVQAQVFLPIFDRQQGRIARSKADINQWNKTEISQKNIIDSEVALAYRRVEMARAKIRRYLQQAIPTSEQLTASADLGYKMGHTDINAVLDVQQRNILLRTQYLQSVLEYQLALNDLEQAVGHPLL